MSNETYCEQLVTKKQTFVSQLLVCLAFFSVLMLTAVCLMSERAYMLSPVALFAGGWAVWRFYTRQRVEFEYILTTGELDVDRITDKRVRRHLLTVACRDFEIFAPVEEALDAQLKPGAYAQTIDASSSANAPGRMFAVFNDAKDRRTLLIFQPNERALVHMRAYISRRVWPT